MPDFTLTGPLPVPVDLVKPPSPENCAGCRFVRSKMEITRMVYRCHRHAPQVVPVPTAPADSPAIWPPTVPDEWCGEGEV